MQCLISLRRRILSEGRILTYFLIPEETVPGSALVMILVCVLWILYFHGII